jgi:hypothetical protein
MQVVLTDDAANASNGRRLLYEHERDPSAIDEQHGQYENEAVNVDVVSSGNSLLRQVFRGVSRSNN